MKPTNYAWHRTIAENQRWKILPTTFGDGSPAYVVQHGTLDYARFTTYEECEQWLKDYLTE